MPDTLPNSVRYVKNGAGGQWWGVAKTTGQIHLGWQIIPDGLLRAAELVQIEALIRKEFGAKRGATQDFNALRTLLDHPSQHVWVTFEDGCMWWCTVHDGIETDPDGESSDRTRGHFWLTCATAWTDYSMSGQRHLVMTDLPGLVTTTSGYQGTVCEPKGAREILRIIRNEEDLDAHAAAVARQAYEEAIAKLVTRLGEKDFEVLVDLILSRSGWARLAKVGGATEGIDIEVENASADEIAFVQVKSSATQATLDDYVSRFNERRDHYQRMIFAVHSSSGNITPPSGQPVQVWDGKQIARLVVKLGLGDWVATRL
jgi:hypothetical protein